LAIEWNFLETYGEALITASHFDRRMPDMTRPGWRWPGFRIQGWLIEMYRRMIWRELISIYSQHVANVRSICYSAMMEFLRNCYRSSRHAFFIMNTGSGAFRLLMWGSQNLWEI